MFRRNAIQNEDIQEQDVFCKVTLPELEPYIMLFDNPECQLTVESDGTAEGTIAILSDGPPPASGQKGGLHIERVHVSVNPDAKREMLRSANAIHNIKFRDTVSFMSCRELWELMPNGVFVFDFGRRGRRFTYIVKEDEDEHTFTFEN